jgi:hypothetical protein
VPEHLHGSLGRELSTDRQRQLAVSDFTDGQFRRRQLSRIRSTDVRTPDGALTGTWPKPLPAAHRQRGLRGLRGNRERPTHHACRCLVSLDTSQPCRFCLGCPQSIDESLVLARRWVGSPKLVAHMSSAPCDAAHSLPSSHFLRLPLALFFFFNFGFCCRCGPWLTRIRAATFAGTCCGATGSAGATCWACWAGSATTSGSVQ